MCSYSARPPDDRKQPRASEGGTAGVSLSGGGAATGMEAWPVCGRVCGMTAALSMAVAFIPEITLHIIDILPARNHQFRVLFFRPGALTAQAAVIASRPARTSAGAGRDTCLSGWPSRRNTSVGQSL